MVPLHPDPLLLLHHFLGLYCSHTAQPRVSLIRTAGAYLYLLREVMALVNWQVAIGCMALAGAMTASIAVFSFDNWIFPLSIALFTLGFVLLLKQRGHHLALVGVGIIPLTWAISLLTGDLFGFRYTISTGLTLGWWLAMLGVYFVRIPGSFFYWLIPFWLWNSLFILSPNPPKEGV